MADQENTDVYFDVAEELGGAAGKKGPGKKHSGLFLPLVVGAVLVAAMAILFVATSRYLSRQAQADAQGVPSGASDADVSKRELTAFVEQFLLNYYNYSAGQYEAAVQRAEAMMTPAFQAAYNQRAEDLGFKQKLNNYRVSTEGIRILPGSVAIGNQGDHYLVQLAGTMTFSTGINGATGDFPLSLLLSVYKTDSGFLVDNVERLR